MGHGLTKTRLYGVWCGMKDRCYNKNSKGYPNYGGRGIVVCEEWKHDFLAFHRWAIEAGYDETAPRGQYTIERKDNDGPYSPDNCRWATMQEQERNKRNNIRVQANGKSLILKDACAELGLNYDTERKSRHRRSQGTVPRDRYLSETDRNREVIRQAIQANPTASIRAIAKITGKSKSAVQRVKASFTE